MLSLTSKTETFRHILNYFSFLFLGLVIAGSYYKRAPCSFYV